MMLNERFWESSFARKMRSGWFWVFLSLWDKMGLWGGGWRGELDYDG